MDNTLRELRAKVRTISLDARALSRVTESEAFGRAWTAATPEQRAALQTFIAGIDKLSVDRWVRLILSGTVLEDKPVRDLRELAIAAGIKYVNVRTKDELIRFIRGVSIEPGCADRAGEAKQGDVAQGGDQ